MYIIARLVLFFHPSFYLIIFLSPEFFMVVLHDFIHSVRVHQISFHSLKFMFFSFHVQPECCRILPLSSCFNRSGFGFFLSIVLVIRSFATSKVQMVFLVSIFLPQCSQLCSTPLCSFFQLFNLSRFFGFTYLAKKQLSLPLLFLLRFSPVPS